MSTSHDHIIDQLSEYIDGELVPQVHAEIDRHLATCAECRQIVAELRGVREHAASLPAIPPAADLWDGVATRIAEPRGRVLPLERRAPRRVSFTLPQLAAACITVMALSGGMVWLAQRGDPRTDFPAMSAETAAAVPRPEAAGEVAPAAFTDAHYENAIDDLESILDQGRDRLDPETVRVLEQNLESIDKAIEQSRRALEADPANTYLNNHLATARQRKLALLRRATALTTGS